MANDTIMEDEQEYNSQEESPVLKKKSNSTIALAVGALFVVGASFVGYTRFIAPQSVPEPTIVQSLPIQKAGQEEPSAITPADGSQQVALNDPSAEMVDDGTNGVVLYDENGNVISNAGVEMAPMPPVEGAATTPVNYDAGKISTTKIDAPVAATPALPGAPAPSAVQPTYNAQVAQAVNPADAAQAVKAAPTQAAPQQNTALTNTTSDLIFPDYKVIPRNGGPVEQRVAILEARIEQLTSVLESRGQKFTKFQAENGKSIDDLKRESAPNKTLNARSAVVAVKAKPKADTVKVVSVKSDKNFLLLDKNEEKVALASEVTVTPMKSSDAPVDKNIQPTQFEGAGIETNSISQATPPVLVASIKPTSMYVYAIVPGRAWVKDNLGNRYTVTEGENLPGYGTVTSINPESGLVSTSNGTIN